jgi:NAD(P)-dependent dehydrogenase (short-subunit alcohol dehydrogenase family)
MTKLCMIVGGSKGLGKSLVEQYQTLDYDVWECSRTGDGQQHLTVDLSRRESAIDLMDSLFAQRSKEPYDEVLLIVNAAMLDPIGPLASSEPKEWWQHIDVNLTMPISIFGRFQTHFNAKNAHKIAAFVSSGASSGPMDGWSLYCASKAGVDHFLRSMALEQTRNQTPIKCVSLNPGIMDTEMQATIRESSADDFSQVERFRSFKTEGALIAPDVVALNIVYALKEPFENGTTLDVRG